MYRVRHSLSKTAYTTALETKQAEAATDNDVASGGDDD